MIFVDAGMAVDPDPDPDEVAVVLDDADADDIMMAVNGKFEFLSDGDVHLCCRVANWAHLMKGALLYWKDSVGDGPTKACRIILSVIMVELRVMEQ